MVRTVTLRAADAARSAPTIAVARDRGLGVALDGEAWRNQLDVDHPLRDARWRALGYDTGPPDAASPTGAWPASTSATT